MPQDLPLALTAAAVFSRQQRSEAGGDVEVAVWLFVHALCDVRVAKSAAWMQKSRMSSGLQWGDAAEGSSPESGYFYFRQFFFSVFSFVSILL